MVVWEWRALVMAFLMVEHRTSCKNKGNGEIQGSFASLRMTT
ncbi:hypothetical protein GRAN_2194 [Granulicella sibirica]|uniref:Uncharacterized protein n=1 Tax=Granulicella sibirica TaxID=2479048 RepID=A0A4V1L6D5_9BACT|nr:hypothetical protein GRAN_2194 [Granulicella sibirica]